MSRNTDIRRALVAQLSELPGQVKVALGESKYDQQLERLVVQIAVGPPNEKTEETLDRLLEPEGKHSAHAVIEQTDDRDRRTLGGLVEDLRVVSHSGYRVYSTPDGPILGAEWQVDYLT